MNPNDIINQAIIGLQTSNENMALKMQNADLKAEVERLRASSFVTSCAGVVAIGGGPIGLARAAGSSPGKTHTFLSSS